MNYGDSQPERSILKKLKSGMYKNCSFLFIENSCMNHYFSGKRIAFVSMAIIMVLTGVSLGVGFGLPTNPSTMLMTTSTTTTSTTTPTTTTTPRFHPSKTCT